MTSKQEELKNITSAILRSQTEQEEMETVGKLSDFYQQLVAYDSEDMDRKNESGLDGGYALATFNAAVCVDEFLRTARFLKGVDAAVQELQERFPNEKLRILYAGCGPYATLMLPLLPLLHLEKLELLWLDIHETSIKSATHILNEIGYTEPPVKFILDNALLYQLDKPVHLVVTETMYRALRREPQAGITKNLAPQIIAGGLLVPEAIHIDLVYSYFAYEPVFERTEQLRMVHQKPYPQSKTIDRLFSLTKDPEFFAGTSNNKFLSGVYTMDGDMETAPDICVYTEVVIYKNIKLGSAQSTITNPWGISCKGNLGPEYKFQLEYNFDSTPDWTLINIG